MKYFKEDLYRRLLSTDFKKQVDGLEMLQKVVLNYILVKSYLMVLCEYFSYLNLLKIIAGTPFHW